MGVRGHARLGQRQRKADLLRPFGELDILPLYTAVSSVLRPFIGDREIASRIWLRQRTLLNRGSKLEPLHVDELAKPDDDLLRIRAEMTLDKSSSESDACIREDLEVLSFKKAM